MSAEPRSPQGTEDLSPLGRPRLTLVPEVPQTQDQPRRPLSRSRVLKTRSHRWKLLALLGSLVAALLVALGLSIVMASRQYDLVELRSQEQLLSQQNEALVQEIEYYQAPQDLAIRASQLGLVASASQATLDLQSGQVVGTPLAAQEGAKEQGNLIAPPALSDTEAYAQASVRAEEQKKKEEAEAKASASASASASAAASQPAASQPSPSFNQQNNN